MADSGCSFVISKIGIVKLFVLTSGCATWAIYVDSKLHRNPPVKTYVLAAYIISWAVSLLLYFFRITGLHLQMNTSCMSFNSFDYFWSWISCINYISSTIILACLYDDRYDPICNRGFCTGAKQLTTIVLGIVTAVLYGLEGQTLKPYAPVGAGYGTTWRGIWKMIILVVGAVAFGLLVQTGYRCGRRNSDCTAARTFVLIAWCVAWGVAALIYLLRLLTCPARLGAGRQVTFGTFEFFWSAFACLLYLVGAAVLAAFLKPGNYRQLLGADICGWVTAVLFGVDAFLLRDHRPVWFVSRRVQSSGGRTVTTTTTTTSERTTRK